MGMNKGEEIAVSKSINSPFQIPASHGNSLWLLVPPSKYHKQIVIASSPFQDNKRNSTE